MCLLFKGTPSPATTRAGMCEDQGVAGQRVVASAQQVCSAVVLLQLFVVIMAEHFLSRRAEAPPPAADWLAGLSGLRCLPPATCRSSSMRPCGFLRDLEEP